MSHNHARGFSFFVLLSLAIAAAAFAAKPISEAPPVTADVTVSASAMQWQTAGSFERLALTVGGPDGYTLHKEFAAGAAPVLRLQDLGAKLADGSYTWELRVVPRVSSETRQKLAAAREAGDDDAIGRIRAEAGIDRETAFSGAFTVMGGSFVSNKGEEPAPAGGGKKIVANGLTPGAPKAEDVVTADDAIIQGSLCVGLDCVNNESFGFDTIRLKENNTRINFTDTSTGAGFPTNDWEITANDSASGGASFLAFTDITGSKVPFKVTAGAATNSLFVASTGKVGLGNSSPVLNLHITTTDTPAIRQEQTSGGGFTAQTWDIGANEANWFVRDVTGGSRLPLRIRPGAPTSSIDISNTGNVGVGTASPVALLDVRGANAHAYVGSNTTDYIGAAQTGYGATNGTEKLFFAIQTGLTFLGSVSSTNLSFITNNQTRATITNAGNFGIGTPSPGAQLVVANGGTTSSLNAGDAQFTVASSRTFKENIEPVETCNILDKIENVPVVTYDFRNNGPKDRIGLIAEDFHQIFGRGDDKHINGQEVQMALWLAVQQLTAQNKQLQERLNTLESQLKQQ
jgi:hypothetical protein